MSERIEVRLKSTHEVVASICIDEGASLSNVEYCIKEGWEAYRKMADPSKSGYHSFAEFLCSKYEHVFHYDVPLQTFYVGK